MASSTLFDLSGKKAVVTGGAAGIGRACALALAESGADVVVADLDEEGAARTVEAVRELGRDSLFVRCDVSSGAQVQAMVDEVVERFSRLDIAVNNAGIYRPGDDETHSEEEWRRIIDVDLTGVWLCANAEMRQMREQVPTQGKIINIGSIAATHAVSNGSYDAAKAGVLHLSATLARQWGRYNINVNTLSPGYVGAVFGKRRPESARQRLRDVTPLGYVMRPRDLVGPLLFLASAASDFVTGQDLLVDGGHGLSTWLLPLPERSVAPRVTQGEELDDGLAPVTEDRPGC